MRPMTSSETVAFLRDGTRTGKVAWVGKDGRPHVAPIWFVVDTSTDGPFEIVFNTHKSTGKAKALEREGQASLVVDDQAPPYSYVKIDGTVSFEHDLATVRAIATEIGGRYMGTDRAEEFGERNGTDGELVVRLTPSRTQAWADVSD